jgi:hypothetical protein
LKIVVRLAATGIAALALTAQAAVLTPANAPFASIEAPFTPEPATFGLIGAGLTTLGLLRRRRTRKD